MERLLGGKPLRINSVSVAPEGVSSSLRSTLVHRRPLVNTKVKIPRVVDRIFEISPNNMTLVTALSTASVKDRSQMRYFPHKAATLRSMSRRLEVELTSKRDDGTYTWRAAGAKQPKGELDGTLLYEGAGVGDIVRVDADFAVDGVFITSVLPPKTKKARAETLDMLGSGKDEGGVTTQLVEKRGRGGRDRGRGRGRGDGDNRGGRGRGRGDGDNRGGRGDRPRNDRPRRERSGGPARPKPKRLRAQRTHRDATLRALPQEQQPLARIVLRDGIAGLRKEIEAQNAEAKTAEQLEIPPKVLEAVGENLLPRLRSAEWRDNAEAAVAGIDEVDLRDLRKVVVAAENGAKDDEARALAEELKTGLQQRVEKEHGKWLAELASLLKEGRTVRALRQSSRPPKAGSPMPPDLASRLAEAASASMTPDTAPDRWGTVMDAVAYSPVRQQVKPVGIPNNINDELRSTAKKLSKRVPHIANLLIAPAPAKAPSTPPIPPAPPSAPPTPPTPPVEPSAPAAAEEGPSEPPAATDA